MDLSHWDLYEEFSDREAACLAAGIDPGLKEFTAEETARINAIHKKITEAYEMAYLNVIGLYGAFPGPDYKTMDSFYSFFPSGALPSVEIVKAMYVCWRVDKQFDHRQFEATTTTRTFSRFALGTWFIGQKFKPEYMFRKEREMTTTLFHPDLCDREFASAVLHVPSLLKWATDSGLHLRTVPSLDGYEFAQVESLLCAIERGAQHEDSTAAAIVATTAVLSEHKAADVVPRWLVGADAHAQWRDKIRTAIKSGDLQLLDAGSLLPVSVKPSDESDGAQPPIDDRHEKDAPAPALAEFRNMQRLSWSEIQMDFVAGESGTALLSINARNTTRRTALAELELINRKNGEMNHQGGVLLALASGQRLPKSPEMPRRVSRLRNILKKHFGIASDPFEAYNQQAGYKPVFRVSDKRNAADERARKSAERKTVSLEDRMLPTDDDDDEATSWLKEHAPDMLEDDDLSR